ncbi:MAG TPA: HAMP domain-containing sensor histidine kinase [Kofleriaceae bacterium]|nr:HAMP domain-containing sensor histidine kinase [Kofleriaceae bacterium]
MPTKRNPQERSSTDESLRSERKKTDAELVQRSSALRDTATDVVTEARDKADSVLSEARGREDRKTGHSTQLTQDRAREDAVLRTERSGADAVARDEVELRRVALASLLAFERQDTDLRLEIERKRADQVLASREDFMAMVSHDLRSLLGGIALSAELLKEAEKSEQPFVHVTLYAERIQRFSARMTRLVADLMDVVSIEAGRLSLLRSRYDANLLLRDSHDAFKLAASVDGVELTCTSEEDLGVVELDHERILQVLTNLVGNALKFTPRGGRITIELGRREDAICFSVADTGSGIPTDLLEKIFDRYFQTESGDRRGLGLGLFISKSIIEAHGGKIWATSTLGKGSTLCFTVPAILA